MRKIRVYLDNCCFNRPFDDQSAIAIRLETDAKLYIQEIVKLGQLELIWSFILDYENNDNPFDEARNQIAIWQSLAVMDCGLTDEIADKSEELMKLGLRQKDAAHLACAIASQADFFITTDKKILNKSLREIKVTNPVDFVRSFIYAE